MRRLTVLLAATALVAACGSGTRSFTPSPVELWVTLEIGSSSIGERTDWKATVCADKKCKTFSPASCEADHGRECIIGIGMTIIFKYPHTADLPDQVSLRIVSDSGETLYSKGGPNRCTSNYNFSICTSRFFVP